MRVVVAENEPFKVAAQHTWDGFGSASALKAMSTAPPKQKKNLLQVSLGIAAEKDRK